MRTFIEADDYIRSIAHLELYGFLRCQVELALS